MRDDSGDELWLTALKNRVEMYRSHIHIRSHHQAVRDRLGKTLSALDGMTKELKALMNAVSVAHLPPEILVSIFRFLSYELPLVPDTVERLTYEKNPEVGSDGEVIDGIETAADTKSVEDTSPSSTWIKALYVCRYWRNVALSDTSLWTDISTPYRWTWSDAFLARSKSSTSLRVHLGANILPMTYINYYVFANTISRARTLHITDCFQDWQHWLDTSSPRSLVKFSVNIAVPNPNRQEFSTAIECPSRFFRNDADVDGPRELSLCGFVSYDWPPPLLSPALTSLKLGVMADRWAILNASVQEVVDTLSQLQSLQSLTLLSIKFIVANPEDDFKAYRDAVHLPRLQLLQIEEGHPETLLFMLNAVVSSAKDIKMCLVPFAHEWRDFHAVEMLDVLKHCLSSPPWDNIHALAILPMDDSPKFLQLGERDDFDSIIVSAWRTNVDALLCVQEERETSKPDIYLHLRWSPDSDSSDCPQQILRLFHHLPIHTLGLLTNEYNFGQSFEWDELQHFATLRHLMLRGLVSTEAIHYLYTKCQDALTCQSFSRHLDSSNHLNLQRLTFLNAPDHYTIKWYQEPLLRDPQGTSPYTYAQLLERVYRMRMRDALPMQIFVHGSDLETSIFDSMSDKSILQAIPNIHGRDT